MKENETCDPLIANGNETVNEVELSTNNLIIFVIRLTR